ncbi:hypothetical protein ES332_D13G192700v1 [Gossypium tomentosum]|uniref:Uncharacterized protein n=1 Tax=Gossypium tomentosum TaxID=34277 RepID=A0A5C7J0Q6_GOSTO|nr:hypothetical protein ES332_1Z013600v1 [Gossypium tomentosum]TYH35434.1 hypothetical protein ES332_D13G192700v1 [Gossypium tomentosum]
MDASEDLKQFGDTDKGGAVFDASQYAFFGNDVLEEDLPAAGLDEEEFLFDQEEVNILVSFSFIFPVSIVLASFCSIAQSVTIRSENKCLPSKCRAKK